MGPRTGLDGRTPFWTAAVRVFDLSLGEMLWSRRTILLLLLVGAPVVLAVAIRLLQAFGLPGMQVQGVRVAGPDLFGVMIWVLFIRFVVPVLGVFYGTALIADEVDDRTITYLFTRPIPRGAVLVGKYLAYLACTALITLPAVAVVYFVIVPPGGSIAATFPKLVVDLGLIAAGLAVYGSLFAFIGAWLNRPLIVGLVFAFGWEPIVMAVPGYLRHLTIAYYLQALVPQAMPQDSTVSLLQSLFRDLPTPATSLVSLAVIGVGFLILAARVVSSREYVLEP